MKLGDKIKTKRGYEGTFITQLFSGDCAVILDGCTYSEAHWYDLVPADDVSLLESNTPNVVKSHYNHCVICGLVYYTGMLHTCPNGGTVHTNQPTYPIMPTYPVIHYLTYPKVY